MEENKALFENLGQRIGILESTGYFSEVRNRALLIQLFITDAVFGGPLGEHLDDAGFAAFNNALRCVARLGCFTIPISKERLSRPRGSKRTYLRETEDFTQRISEDNAPRSSELNV